MKKSTTNRLRHLCLAALFFLGVCSAFADGNVAKMGETEYTTLKDAIEAVSDENSEVTLLAKVTLTETINCSKSFTLNLSSYSITKGKYSLALADNVTVKTSKTATYFSTSVEGKQICRKKVTDGYEYTPAVPEASMTGAVFATLKDAIEDHTYTTITLLKDVTLNDDVDFDKQSGTLTLTLGNYSITSNDNKKIYLHKDVVVKLDKQISDENNIFAINSAETGTLRTYTDNNKYCYVFASAKEAKINEIEYDTFSDAASAANENTITLLRNVVDAYTMTSANQTLKVQKNGYSVTVVGYEGFVAKGTTDDDGVTTYTQEAAKIKATKGDDVSYLSTFPSNLAMGTTYQLLQDYRSLRITTPSSGSGAITLDLNGHTFTSTQDSSYDAIVLRTAGTTFNITDTSTDGGGVFDGTTANAVIGANPSCKNCTINIGSKVTIKGCVVVMNSGNTLNVEGTIDGVNDFAVATNGSKTTSGSINIKEGAQITSNTVAVYLPSVTTTTISGGSITGSTGVYQKSGTLTITGGTINGTGAKEDFAHYDNGVNSTGDALVIENCGYPGGDPTVSITGGTFTSTNANAVASYAYGDGKEAITGFIKGGTYSSDVSEFVEDGYEAVKKTENDVDTWIVGKVTEAEVTAVGGQENTYSTTKEVKDSNNESLISQTVTIAVSASTAEEVAASEEAVGVISLESVKVTDIVAAAVEESVDAELGDGTYNVEVELVINASEPVASLSTTKTLTFDVKPEALITVKKDETEVNSTTMTIDNDNLQSGSSFTFTLDVSELGLADGSVDVLHKSEGYSDETLTGTVSSGMVTITTAHFSEFIISAGLSESSDVTLTDGTSVYQIDANKTVNSITYNRTFSDSQTDKYQAWFVPFDYTITGSEGATFYRISFIAAAGEEGVVADENAVYLYVTQLTSGATLKGNRPYLIVPTAAETMTFTPTSKQLLAKADGSRLDMSTAKNTYNFYGTYDTKNATAAHEFLGMSGGQICWNASASATLGAYRWYITLTSRDGNADYSKLRFVITDEDEEDATGIAHVINMVEDVEGYYSLNGTRLNALVKGVNIVKFKNGEVRKVYIQ